MNIDYTMSIGDWKAIIKEFIEILTDFFGRLGINIFKEG